MIALNENSPDTNPDNLREKVVENKERINQMIKDLDNIHNEVIAEVNLLQIITHELEQIDTIGDTSKRTEKIIELNKIQERVMQKLETAEQRETEITRTDFKLELLELKTEIQNIVPGVELA